MIDTTVEDLSQLTLDSLRGCLKKSPSTTSCKPPKGRVSFDSIEILEFPIELGDNPAVHAGPPIQIGWTPQKSDVLEIDIYEVLRHRRRSRGELCLPIGARTETLLAHGYSLEDIEAASSECEKVKRERCRSAGCRCQSSDCKLPTNQPAGNDLVC